MKPPTKPKPSVLKVKADNIPAELKSLSQWVCWKLEWDPKGKKWTKPPYNPRYKSRKAKSNDPKTWTDFDTAIKAYKTNGFDGVGFQLAGNDPYTGWDGDDCVDPGTRVLLPSVGTNLDD